MIYVRINTYVSLLLLERHWHVCARALNLKFSPDRGIHAGVVNEPSA